MFLWGHVALMLGGFLYCAMLGARKGYQDATEQDYRPWVDWLIEVRFWGSVAIVVIIQLLLQGVWSLWAGNGMWVIAGSVLSIAGSCLARKITFRSIPKTPQY